VPEAARITDQVTHTLGLGGLLGGLIAGAMIGAAVVATGGAAAIAIAAAAATGASLGAGLLGFIGSFFQSPPTGAITLVGSPDVLIGRLPAARAVMESADCSGPVPFVWPHPQEKIAQGSETVFVNGMNAARKGDKLVAGAEITTGCKTVIIGGNTATLLEIGPEYPKWLDYAVIALGIVSGFGALRLAGLTALRSGFVLGAGFVGGEFGSFVAQWLAQKAGLGETGQKIAGFIGAIVGGVIAGGAAYKAVQPLPRELPPGPPPPKQLPAMARGPVQRLADGVQNLPRKGPTIEAARPGDVARMRTSNGQEFTGRSKFADNNLHPRVQEALDNVPPADRSPLLSMAGVPRSTRSTRP
jgi:uncharacterized Zn-binding protein involved in type VI secretion